MGDHGGPVDPAAGLVTKRKSGIFPRGNKVARYRGFLPRI
jgi:hypothetical protein